MLMQTISLVQNDTGRSILFHVADYVVPSSATVTIYAAKPSGKIVYDNCTTVNGAVLYKVTNQMIAETGKTYFQIEITENNQVITSFLGEFNVQRRINDGTAIESKDEFKALEKALSEIAEYRKNGLKGDKGDAATIKIGSVTASEPGGEALVKNTGDSHNAVLDITIPRGEVGPIGETGRVENLPGQVLELDDLEERKNLETKDTIKTMFSKVRKFFADLKAVCFSGTATDISVDDSNFTIKGTDVQTQMALHDAAIKAQNSTFNTVIHIAFGNEIANANELVNKFEKSLAGSIAVIFRLKLVAGISPTNSDDWIKGIYMFQNYIGSASESTILGNILAMSQNSDLYVGTLAITNGVATLKWIKK